MRAGRLSAATRTARPAGQVRRDLAGRRADPIISARTLDAISAAAFGRLKAAYLHPAALAAAPPSAIESLIADVTFADVKAERVAGSMAKIRERRGDFDLAFLEALPLDEALAWLED